MNSQSACPPFSNALTNLGFELVDNGQKADFYIGFNHLSRQYKNFIKLGGIKEQAVLVRLEPEAVFPAQYSKRIESLYGKVFTLGGINNSESGGIAWPYYLNANPLNPDPWTQNSQDIIKQRIQGQSFSLDGWKGRSQLLTLIASNKVSAVNNSNYKLRRDLAWRLPYSYLCVFGNLWNSSFESKLKHRIAVLLFALKTGSRVNILQIYGNLFRRYPNYRGQLLNKHEVIADSKFSLVVENDNGYVSEKLIDALIGGSIPIYFGGEFSNLGIPKSAVVTELNTENEIIDFIDHVTDNEISDRLKAIKELVSSSNFLSAWFGDHVFGTLAHEIETYFRKMVA
jgi:hypothetical protein